MIVILDYGMGNLRSVERAVRHLGYEPRVQGHIGGAERLIIPGVGAFGAAMQRLQHLKPEIQSFAEGGNPLLGICLGQQLLFESSEEHGQHQGLGLLAGTVRYFPADLGVKVPHIGWNRVAFSQPEGLGAGWSEGDQVYFVHSLYTECAELDDVAAWTEYGIRFASAVQRKNIWGAQFHPEKSGDVGLRMLENFLRC